MTPREILKQVYGYDRFHPGQEEAITGILNGRDALCVMPTGAGKSMCYQLPALILPGLTLVISPLISLMKDQVNALNRQGISAAYLNSSQSPAEFGETVFQASCGMYKILYVAPERLTVPSFCEMCINTEISFVAVDEAHCISQWGQDFRPGYLRIAGFIAGLPRRPVVGAFTATATAQVTDDIVKYLALLNPLRVSTGFDRPNLSFIVRQPSDKDEYLLSLLHERDGQSGIVYCATRKNVESVHEMLCANGIPAVRYHAGLPADERRRNQDDFLFDRKLVMVATNAFGMGIDKSNVSFVIHYNMPQSVEAYYQEAGRAGRDGCDADCILLYSPKDTVTAQWLIDHRDPNPDLTPEEQASVTEKDHERLKRMAYYAKCDSCLRRYILRYFGENAPDNCGNCSNCSSLCEAVDVTEDARKILSCIVRAGQHETSDTVADILLAKGGAGTDENGFAGLTTWGIMKDVPRRRIMKELQLLERLKVITVTDGIPRLTESARDVLQGRRRITMRPETVLRGNSSADNEKLLSELKYLRLQLASEEHVAAFIIFSDATLRDLCVKKPRTRQELLQVSGMGTFKVNRYGDRILEITRRNAGARSPLDELKTRFRAKYPSAKRGR